MTTTLSAPILPELRDASAESRFIEREYSSEHGLMTFEQVCALLEARNLMIGQREIELEGEFLR